MIFTCFTSINTLAHLGDELIDNFHDQTSQPLTEISCQTLADCAKDPSLKCWQDAHATGKLLHLAGEFKAAVGSAGVTLKTPGLKILTPAHWESQVKLWKDSFEPESA